MCFMIRPRRVKFWKMLTSGRPYVFSRKQLMTIWAYAIVQAPNMMAASTSSVGVRSCSRL